MSYGLRLYNQQGTENTQNSQNTFILDSFQPTEATITKSYPLEAGEILEASFLVETSTVANPANRWIVTGVSISGGTLNVTCAAVGFYTTTVMVFKRGTSLG